jgi:hypothetical protein
MVKDRVSWAGILLRILGALILVVVTYNPTGTSYFHWALTDLGSFSALKALAGALLLGAWALYAHAAMASLGWFGLVLLLLVLGASVWLLMDQRILDPSRPTVLSWVGLVVLGLVLGIGLSWSIVRRRITGQVDVDAVDQ